MQAGNRGMDALAEVAATYGGPDFAINKFAIAGASKVMNIIFFYFNVHQLLKIANKD